MNEYIKKTAQKGVQQNNVAPVQAKMTNGIPNSALNDVFAGKRRADSSMMGHSQNLAPSIAAKMSRAFGMDLTGMQVYHSDAMKDTGMRGMAQGNKVVLSSDVDLNTTAGQAVLGHEISHIHAQSQGVGMGHSGLYENAALEHQADTEGLLAAQGRSIYQGGMDAGIGMQYGLGMQGVEGLTPLSGGMSASAGAPMQAKKGGVDISKISQDKKNKWIEEYYQLHPEEAFNRPVGKLHLSASVNTSKMNSNDITTMMFKSNGEKRTEQEMEAYSREFNESQRKINSLMPSVRANINRFYQKEEQMKKGGLFTKVKNLLFGKKKEKDPYTNKLSLDNYKEK